jgi:hypothetical protein
MKKIIIATAIALSACTSAQLQTAQGNLAKLQTAVVNGCMVVQPVLVSVAALDPTLAAAATANGLFCAGASSVSVTSVQTAISTGIPAISAAVNSSTVIPADKKPLIAGALGAFQLLLTNALEVYGPVTAAPATPASGV